jgi:mRNA interferase MazF
LVISPRAYNRRVGLALFCPVTSHVKGYPFEVPLPAGLRIQGVVLADQLKSLDWRVRKVRFAAQASREVLEEVVARALALIDPDEAG